MLLRTISRSLDQRLRRNGRTWSMFSTLAALLMLLPLGICRGDESLAFPSLTTKQGVTYQAVKVARFDAMEVRFTHATGVATVRLADLPVEVQKIFGYDPRNESVLMSAKQQERARAIIEEADKKAKAAAALGAGSPLQWPPQACRYWPTGSKLFFSISSSANDV